MWARCCHVSGVSLDVKLVVVSRVLLFSFSASERSEEGVGWRWEEHAKAGEGGTHIRAS